MSAQLLLDKRGSIPYTYLNDLESIFWVFFWVVINHTEEGQHRNEAARNLATELMISNAHHLGLIKKHLLGRGASREEVKQIDNLWSMDAVDPIVEFANILDGQMYAPDGKVKYREIFTNPDITSRPDPWIVFKSIIDVFDRHIIRLQCTDQQTD
jgi:hypothetical protein